MRCPSIPALGALALILAAACSSPLANRDPTGEVLPSVSGTSLDGDPFRLPEDLAGAPAVLVLGFVQEAQFDADRWLLGLLQGGLDLRALEVPTARGWVPARLRGRIDAGMRSGIPSEDWASVWTVYGPGAELLQSFTGNEGPRNARVLLLDAQGQVRWFHDRGFSPAKLLELSAAAGALEREPAR